ncbi:MAG: sigma-70 family RNA polymerase sigma factor [Acidobacteria bacterium]|nr:sigma-70 family RNA polymerase sigma factor [Acidobacteriota bacterium]
MAPAGSPRSRFETTEWSLVLAAAGDDSEGGEALARLCSMYWYPVYAFVRRHVGTAEEAQDLTQGFFTRVLEKQELGRVDRNRGRFRSFLLTACRHYIANEWDHRNAVKRGGSATMIPIDLLEAEGRYERALSSPETPERLYERQWALTMMAVVLDTVHRDYVEAGKERLFDRLSGCLAESDGTYEDAARELGMSRSAVKMAVHRLRKRYRDALRQHVADTLDSPAAVDDEIRQLMIAAGM